MQANAGANFPICCPYCQRRLQGLVTVKLQAIRFVESGPAAESQASTEPVEEPVSAREMETMLEAAMESPTQILAQHLQAQSSAAGEGPLVEASQILVEDSQLSSASSHGTHITAEYSEASGAADEDTQLSAVESQFEVEDSQLEGPPLKQPRF